MTVQATKNAPVQMVERTGPEIFKFETPGASLRGQLISIDSTEIDGKPTLRYIVKDGEDERLFSFLGTVDLNTKIRSSDVGKIIEVRYERNDTQAAAGKHPMKRFKVLVQN